MTIERICPVCGRVTVLEVDSEQFLHWQLGTPVQKAFPELSPLERETIVTGVCSDKCWDWLFL